MSKPDPGHSNASFVPDAEQTPNPSGVIDKRKFVIALKEEEEYDPYQNRQVKVPTTNTETFIHFLKGSLGTGILAMPMAFNNAGWLVGFIGTALIGMLCTYCIHQLITSAYELCKRKKIPSMSYPVVAEAALKEGPAWSRACAPYIISVVNTFLIVYLLGSCCVYVVFVATNIKSILDIYLPETTDVRLVMLVLLLPLILINWVRKLKYLAPFSTVANLVTMISFVIIAYYIFREPVNFELVDAVGDLKNLPLFFGTVLFALEAIYVILPLENEMKTPKAFGGKFGVLNKAMIIIVVLYVSMGQLGYMKYGKDIKGTVTLNLPNEVLAHVVQGMLAFAIFVSHGLACFVAIDIAWSDYIVKRFIASPHKLFWEYTTRTALVLVTFLLAVAIPNLELFISLFGALGLSALGLAFPAWFQMCVHYYEYKGSKKVWLVVRNSLIAIFALMGLVIGTWTSLKEIIHTLSSD